MLHEIKIHPAPFEAWKDGRKKCEFRNMDRGYKVGDEILLKEWKPKTKKFTGRGLKVTITHIETETKFGIPTGYGVLSCSCIGFIKT